MKRYKIQTNYNLNCVARMVESDGGEWIRYSDYLNEKEKIRKARKELLDIYKYTLLNAEKERIPSFDPDDLFDMEKAPWLDE